ncbi:MAG: PIN domain-containing protein [Acidobacteria bacterium]|nr:PIN domain-containing protein [Acidobacteriota bacterium]
MKVLIDTSVWSLALRRTGAAHPSRARLEVLIQNGLVAIIGPIRQEILSGVKVESQFKLLRENLRNFPDVFLTSEDYEEAASYFNKCRARGIQGSNTDFLICAASVRRDMSIFTTDTDFQHYAKILPIHLDS